MKNTPCVQCIYLIGNKGSYHCRSQETSLDDDIALGWVGDELPDCPFFSERQPVDKIPLGSDSLVVAKPTRRRRRKRAYTPPTYFNADINDTYREICVIVERFNKDKGKSPSALQIYNLSRFRSKGTVINVLRRMVDVGILKKNDNVTARKYTFGFEVKKFP